MKMNNWDPDFYNEPSEFEQMIDEFKRTLMNSVKAEHKDEIKKLRTENANLQTIKNDWKNINYLYESKHRQLENERSTMERTVSKKRLNDLMIDFEISLYNARSERVVGEKCNECDDKRRIAYTTPQGRKTYEECKCNNGKQVYSPQELKCFEIFLSRDGNRMVGLYKKRNYGDDGMKETEYDYENIYKIGTEYENVNSYRTAFRTKEDCQKYCDWLNDKG